MKDRRQQRRKTVYVLRHRCYKEHFLNIKEGCCDSELFILAVRRLIKKHKFSPTEQTDVSGICLMYKIKEKSHLTYSGQACSLA